MKNNMFVTPEYVTAQEVKRIRMQLGLTQKEFAMLINCSKATIERWETTDEPIQGNIVLLLILLERNLSISEELKVPPKVYPLRLWYMHEQKVCTIIDVNEAEKKVSIKNFTPNPFFCAFGNEKAPDYDSYLEFLKSRCFPESRDKLKLVLRDLGIPFYDPFLIIEKTEGRMAEDKFWLRIER